MQAIMLDTWTARHIYDSIVSMKRDPAFLTKIGNQYELHVYPLESGKFRRIKMNFITPTKWYGDSALCELPLKFLKASAGATIPITMLFRTTELSWSYPIVKKLPQVEFSNFMDIWVILIREHL